MNKKWTLASSSTAFAAAFFLAVCSPTARADSGAIQLQRLPNLLIEGEGPDAQPPGIDPTLVASSGANTNGYGRVVLTKKTGLQDFFVEARNLPPGQTSFNFAYGVFLATAPGSTNFYPVGVMDLVKANRKTNKGIWRLRQSSTNGVPPQLGVDDIAELEGREIRIVTSPLSPDPNKVVLHAILPPVLANPKLLSARTNIVMSLPPAGIGSPTSPQGVGTLSVSFDGRTGRSVVTVRANRLARGTGFTVFLENEPNSGEFTEIEELNESSQFPNGVAGGKLTLDTRRGEPLTFFAETPHELAGRLILVVDPFFDAFNPQASSVHLMATLPSFP